MCDCTPGFTGATCQTDIDDCDPNPCKNGGTCQDEINSFTCSCAPNFIGTTCEASVETIDNNRNSQPLKGNSGLTSMFIVCDYILMVNL